VVYSKLNYKLYSVGIDGNLLLWIIEYLSCRKQSTVIDGVFSSYTDVISGVPQGSVLGPLLFILYMNDLPNFIMQRHSLQVSPLKLFADDIKMYCIVNTL